jgi:hypothetical protein
MSSKQFLEFEFIFRTDLLMWLNKCDERIYEENHRLFCHLIEGYKLWCVIKIEIFSAKARCLVLESTVGAGQNGKLLNVSEVSELRCAYIQGLARVPIFCSHLVLSNLI